MKTNITQKLSAIWFLGFGIYDHFSGRGIEALILNLTALICWHIIFSDRTKKVDIFYM